MSRKTFPAELIIEFMMHFPLQTLIAARCVCREWRELVAASPLLPARRALLDLFLDITSNARYRNNKARLTSDEKSELAGCPKQDKPFDRDEYVRLLLAQHSYIPQEFLLWILEWPEEVVIGRLWPTLPATPRPTADELMKTDRTAINHWGSNMLGLRPPILYAVSFDADTRDGFPDGEAVPVLQIWRTSYTEKTLLVFHDSDYFREHGEVYRVGEGFDVEPGIYLDHEVQARHFVKPRGWISWLRLYFNELAFDMETGRHDSALRVDAEMKLAIPWTKWKEQTSAVDPDDAGQ